VEAHITMRMKRFCAVKKIDVLTRFYDVSILELMSFVYCVIYFSAWQSATTICSTE